MREFFGFFFRVKVERERQRERERERERVSFVFSEVLGSPAPLLAHDTTESSLLNELFRSISNAEREVMQVVGCKSSRTKGEDSK